MSDEPKVSTWRWTKGKKGKDAEIKVRTCVERDHDPKRETFWCVGDDTTDDIRSYVANNHEQAARELLDLRHENTNQKNAIAHLSRCARRAVSDRDAALKQLDDERETVKRCESTIAELRERLEKAKEKGTRIRAVKKGGSR